MVFRDRPGVRAGGHRGLPRDRRADARRRFPDGGSLSIEFTDQAPDDEHPRLGAWLELRAEDPAAVMRAALDAGLPEVKHPGHPYYVMVPGGQVFTIAPLH
jgi:hypothetical protein